MMDPNISMQADAPGPMPSPPEQPPIAPRNSNYTPLFMVIIILLFVVASYVGYQNWQLQQKVSQKTVSQTVQPSPTPTPNPTADWKTFTNTTYGYALKLPSYLNQFTGYTGASVRPVNDADWIFVKEDKSSLDPAHKTIASTGSIVLEIASFGAGTAQGNYNLHCNQGAYLTFNQLDPRLSKDSPVAGVDQFIQSSGVAAHSTVPTIKYWDMKVCFIKNGIDYEVYYQNYERTNEDATPAQILSTFQFIHNPLTGGANTSTNSKNGVTVTISPSSGPVGTPVAVSISGLVANTDFPYASIGFLNSQGPGADSTSSVGRIDTRTMTTQSYTKTYTIPNGVLVAVSPNAQNPSQPEPIQPGSASITFSYADLTLSVPFMVTR